LCYVCAPVILTPLTGTHLDANRPSPSLALAHIWVYVRGMGADHETGKALLGHFDIGGREQRARNAVPGPKVAHKRVTQRIHLAPPAPRTHPSAHSHRERERERERYTHAHDPPLQSVRINTEAEGHMASCVVALGG
jgi:hypothetical protein